MTHAVNAVSVVENKIWIECDVFGNRHVMVGREGSENPPFQHCSFNYDYRYTSNASIAAQAESFAVSLGAEPPVECRARLL